MKKSPEGDLKLVENNGVEPMTSSPNAFGACKRSSQLS